jgi:hypothetical protein
MTEERFEELVRDAAETYHAPDETPRERIWARVRDARAARPARPRGAWAWLRSPLTLRWWPAAAAALLVAGILIGRLWPAAETGVPGEDQQLLAGQQESASPPAATAAPSSETRRRRSDAFAQAANPYLGRVEVLLTVAGRDASAPGEAPDMAAWARGLLTETRLLLDSPAADDEDLGLLLNDLELVLAQIIRRAGGESPVRNSWLRNTLEQRAILTRLRSRLPAGESGVGI